jgi:hypothetical protein
MRTSPKILLVTALSWAFGSSNGARAALPEGTATPAVRDATSAPRMNRKEQLSAIVAELRIERILYLDPMERKTDDNLLHGWQIAGATSAPLPEAAEQALKSRLLQLIAPQQSSGEGVSYCAFAPRHAVTLSDDIRRFDVLVCFACGEYEIYEDGTLWLEGGFSTNPAADWERAFEAAGLSEPEWKMRRH